MLKVDAPQGVTMRDGKESLNVSWKGMEEYVTLPTVFRILLGHGYTDVVLIDRRCSCILWNPADETGEGMLHDIPKGDGVSLGISQLRPLALTFS